MEVPLEDGTRVAVERTPLDLARKALVEIGQILADSNLPHLLGPRYAEVERQLLVERAQIIAVIDEHESKARAQIQARVN